MTEYNYFLTIKYGFTPQLPEIEWNATITSTDFPDEDRFIESAREFYKHVKKMMELRKGSDEVQDL